MDKADMIIIHNFINLNYTDFEEFALETINQEQIDELMQKLDKAIEG